MSKLDVLASSLDIRRAVAVATFAVRAHARGRHESFSIATVCLEDLVPRRKSVNGWRRPCTPVSRVSRSSGQRQASHPASQPRTISIYTAGTGKSMSSSTEA